MSLKQEKQVPLAALEHRLRLLALDQEPAAKNMLREMVQANIPGALVESVDQLLTFALHKQKEKFKEQLQTLIGEL